MDDGGRVGFEYNHRFLTTDDILSNTDAYTLFPGVKNLIFELRTNFVLKKIKTTTKDSHDEIIGSEKLPIASLRYDDCAYSLLFHLYYRLDYYWMTPDQMNRLSRDAVDFARSQPSDRDVIPVVVELDVCTVQQEAEAIEDTRQRAITSNHLVPLYLWETGKIKYNKPPWLMNFLRRLEKFRVENIEVGLGNTKVCSICLNSTSYIGANISRLSTCGHAFHYHCIVGSLEYDNLCPECHSPAYDRECMHL